MGFTRRPDYYHRILKELKREWNRINKQALENAISSLYKNKLINIKRNPNGMISLILLDEGKQKVLSYKLEDLIIQKPKKWDGKWRVVISDIPEKIKKIRELMRNHLKRLGFIELQKSVFIIPYFCENEVEFLVEFYGIRQHVRQILAENLDNEIHLKDIFNIQ